MLIFYTDISDVQMENLKSQNTYLTLLEKITSYVSLGAYLQGYSICDHVIFGRHQLVMQCSGDLIIQDVFGVNIFDHKS